MNATTLISKAAQPARPATEELLLLARQLEQAAGELVLASDRLLPLSHRPPENAANPTPYAILPPWHESLAEPMREALRKLAYVRDVLDRTDI